MPVRAYLIRHGQTDSNVNHLLDTAYPGAPLNDTGLAQAQRLAERLADVDLQAVWSSDLHRAVQTATPLAVARGLEVRQDRRFREIPAGVEELSPDWQLYADMIMTWRHDMDFALDGAESAHTVLGRFDAGMADLAAEHQIVSVVTHGAMLGVWAAFRVGVDPRVIGELGNTDVVVVDGDPADGWRLVSLAEL